MSDWRVRARALADELTAKGTLSSPAWQRAVAEVPRHELHIPRRGEIRNQHDQVPWPDTLDGPITSNWVVYTLGRNRSERPMIMADDKPLFVTRRNNVLSPKMT